MLTPGMPSAAGSPAGGAAPQSQQAPFGSSPATGPTPNKGYEAAGLQRLGIALKQLEQLVPLLGATTDPGKDVLKVIGILSKHVPPGSSTPAAEKNNIEQMAMRNAQQQQQAQMLRQQQAQSAQQPKAAA